MPMKGRNFELPVAYFAFNFSTGMSLCANKENNTTNKSKIIELV
jgi:hypothetical protein